MEPTPTLARSFWTAIEPIHSVAYFAPEAIAGMQSLGLRGFWMGYFAGRFAPLGALGPAPVAAMSYSFAPALAARAIPDAWRYAAPGDALAARLSSAAGALRDRAGRPDRPRPDRRKRDPGPQPGRGLPPMSGPGPASAGVGTAAVARPGPGLVIRPAGVGDRAEVAAMFARCSPETAYRRFHGQVTISPARTWPRPGLVRWRPGRGRRPARRNRAGRQARAAARPPLPSPRQVRPQPLVRAQARPGSICRQAASLVRAGPRRPATRARRGR